MAGADLDEGATKEAIAQLIPEPANPHDPNAVSVQVDGKLVGYLPKEIAPKYAPVLASMRYSGLIPSAPAHLWARAFDDYDEKLDGTYVVVRRYHTAVFIALAEPDQIQPINLAPPRPRAELPVGTSVKVTGTQQNFAHLDAVLAGRRLGWVYATLHRLDFPSPRSRKSVVEVRVNGRPAGTLTPQMSDVYLPLIDRLDQVRCTVVARVLLEGSPVSVVAAMHAVRSHELSAEWVNDATTQGG